MSSSPQDPPSPSTPPLHASTPIYTKKQPSLNVELPSTPLTPPINVIPGEPTLTPPPVSPLAPPEAGDVAPPTISHPVAVRPPQPVSTPTQHASNHPDGTSSDKSSETAVIKPSSCQLSRKESYKAQRQHYRREKKRAASALLHSIHDPSVVVLADWLKVRGSLKSWTKLWCVLKPGLLLLYKSPKAKSSHWVGTVLLTSCQVIERPSKKDGFCFKLYHPLEQSIWAPRGPHNETIGAVVQPLPTAHLIFRAPSQAAGHCWLDGLELALRCSNAMLRCGQPRAEAAADVSQPSLSHEELEKHFNEHGQSNPLRSYSTALLSVSDYTSNYLYQNQNSPKAKKTSKWTQFVESIDLLKDSSESEVERDDKNSFLDFLRKKETFDCNTATTSSVRYLSAKENVEKTSKSMTSSPSKYDGSLVKKVPILRCFDFDITKLQLPSDKKVKRISSPTNIIEDHLLKLVTSFPRRSSTPSVVKTFTKTRMQELRISGAKTDSDNEDYNNKQYNNKQYSNEEYNNNPAYKRKRGVSPRVRITKTTPSVEDYKNYSSSSTDDIERIRSPNFRPLDPRSPTPEKYSLIDYRKIPSVSYAALNQQRMGDRISMQNVYVAGQIVPCELAGAASESDSSDYQGMSVPPPRKQDILARILREWVEDPDKQIGAAGELVEEVAEENKSLLWFLLKQVRPGMDLSKVVLPTFILEPRSFLDKLSDTYYHADILSEAQSIEDPYLRFKCVLRWFLSGLYKKPKGLKKPYNPVLGETFRCCWRHPGDTTTYYVAEQVSHHPPVSAFYVSNRKDGFVVQGSLLARSKFYGNSTSAILEGCARVHLLPWGETYVTTAPYAHCKGIVIGTLSMELGGKVHVICNETGYQADIEFKLRSFLGSAESTNAITGRIKKGKEIIAQVDGYWDGKIDIKDKRTGQESTFLDCAILKTQRLRRYLMKLDNQHEYESQKLWIKVSEAIAKEDQVAATEQKTVIEEAQRTRAKDVNAPPWVSRIFSKEPPETPPPEGIVDQGWKYNHCNISPWQDDEILEYEEDFVIQSLMTSGAESRLSMKRQSASERDLPTLLPGTDTDEHDGKPRQSKTRNLKQTLFSIDASLREQAVAIERLSKAVESISENQKVATRPLNLGRIPSSSHIWNLFVGFVLAVVLQALLKLLF